MEKVSTFETLPDEMILHVCQYLRGGEILHSFFNLNSRLNSAITDFCHHVNLKNLTYKQFKFVTLQIVPQIGGAIRSFVFNGRWESIMFTQQSSIFSRLKLSLTFPQLHTLILINFVGAQSNLFLDKITDFFQLVKLDIRSAQVCNSYDSLKAILGANNNRLKSVSFDYNSLEFVLTSTKDEKAVSYPNIEELTVSLKTDKTLGSLFILLPNITRLHVDVDELSSASKRTLENIPSLVHLKDFQLRSLDMQWSLDEIAYILSKMPSLQRLVLDIFTQDKHVVHGEKFIQVPPSTLIEIHLFIMYYLSTSGNETDTILSTWPSYIRVIRLPHESNRYGVIHTVPCDLFSMFIPAYVASSMMAGSKYTRKVQYLKICDKQCSSDINLILQHFHQIRTLTIGPSYNSQKITSQSNQPIVLHLPHLKRFNVNGIYEIFHLVEAAPNLDYLKIDLNSFNMALDDISTCELLQKRIVNLEITNIQEIDSIPLGIISRQFSNLRDLSLCVEKSTVFIDSLILAVLSMWKDKNLRSFHIKGSLTYDVSKNLSQWLINYNNLDSEDSFHVEYDSKWIVVWYQ
ncbi:unnamed protein product [Rotaria magnacalcarata]|uniref:F-box domain-containing protein n=1 Tax=Rotaria magnacalcarata TaxID=392030 RepID=A0A816WE10_9BILA|nr:unnamed protein product [Rotaria magnacalcarata]CAF3781738.1 unnamed protein product [Rotaria magnacalcarata]